MSEHDWRRQSVTASLPPLTIRASWLDLAGRGFRPGVVVPTIRRLAEAEVFGRDCELPCQTPEVATTGHLLPCLPPVDGRLVDPEAGSQGSEGEGARCHLGPFLPELPKTIRHGYRVAMLPHLRLVFETPMRYGRICEMSSNALASWEVNDMGWGDPPHEGYVARVLRDGRLTGVWSAETNRESTGWGGLVCTCGWRGGRYRAFGVDAEGRRWWPEATDADMEAEDDAAYREWRQDHMAPLIDPLPENRLVLGNDAGGRRHFLAGRPVHAGTGLELRLLDGVWVRIRYEWNWDPKRRPDAYLGLGGPGEAIGPEWTPAPVSFPLPELAELRWPAGARRDT